ncbi:imidazole glycerol phosphate synthase subunit HisH [Vagococcus bubulae]|uniref:Imidazole glycerol phosphate synthase subunit HisH n=1 Tax=Vagococcus bubulae TaxID=1977868 RepID=A0A429ZK60_9ENTE|nr:imidazole glycerol phosphate synthase subunit HisH [Vagococcus bubulae]RST94071.1 imidazole glycerol phosphate synthase subunit HisH [Vagococcus bubulae]
MIVVIDYGAGNTKSVIRALEKNDIQAVLSSDKRDIESANGLILPGVGAFPLAMEELEKRQLIDVIKQEVAKGKPLLGICLGMQLLVDGSDEHRYTKGFGFIPGECKQLPASHTFPVPHMGWNQLDIKQNTPLTRGIANEYVYFVHSYAVDVAPIYIEASCQYSQEIPAVISYKNVYGTQFHPEKSGEVGHKLLRNFKEIVYEYTTSN